MGSPTQTEMWEEERDEALNGNMLEDDEEDDDVKDVIEDDDE